MLRSVIIGSALLFWGAWGVTMASEDKTQRQGDVPKVVAKVNGKNISGEEYKKLLKQMEASQAQKGPGGKSIDPEILKEQVMDRLITIEVLSQRAEQLNIRPDPKELDQKMEEIKKNVGGEQALGEALKAHGITVHELRADIQRSITIQKLLDQEVFDKVKVDKAETKGFYDSNPQVFRIPEQVRARHIVVRVKQGASDQERKQARAEIEKAAERIRKGEPFENVAKEVSQDGAAQRGGDLGYFSRGQMVPEFENVAFGLEKGKVSPVVETQFGYHLIKVEDKREARTLGFEEVESKIEEFLRQRKGEESLRDYVNGLKSQAKIERASF